MKNQIVKTQKEVEDASIKGGRAFLKKWLLAAESHGTVYYRVPHVAKSGMSLRIVLATIIHSRRPAIVRLGPGIETVPISGIPYSESLDIIAKDWGFDWEKRSFLVRGTGSNMVLELLHKLVRMSGLTSRTDLFPAGYVNTVRREEY